MTVEEVATLIRRSLARSGAVEIDGLGVFSRTESGGISFRRSGKYRVFIAYATEDQAAAERLFNDLTRRDFVAWLDRKRLLPGQHWPHRIEDAIASADFFIACFSGKSVGKRGGFQAEVRHALDCAKRVPLDDVFLIPVRLDDCRIPPSIERETQYVDLFPDWNAGFDRILRIMETQTGRLS